MKSDVYFIKTSDNTTGTRALSLLKLLEAICPFKDYKKDEFIPVKLTIGDSQCTYNISPELVKVIVTSIKNKKAKPFIFDTNVIYKGERQNAVDHLTLSQSKGFGYTKTGAPFVIGDGLFGEDGKTYEIESPYIKTIKIPSFIGMLDNLVVLSHATGHILSGYAGAIKNVAMGMSSKAVKQVQHSSLKPTIIEKKCTSCGCCINICPVNAIHSPSPYPSPQRGEGKVRGLFIDQSKCIGCGECLCACKFNAVYINWSEDHDVFVKRIVDVCRFILSKFKNKFFITFAFDITKECDCISDKNEKIFSKDIGILASQDPLALDNAVVSLINKDSDLFEKEGLENTYKTMFEYAHEKGLGNLGYNLIEI